MSPLFRVGLHAVSETSDGMHKTSKLRDKGMLLTQTVREIHPKGRKRQRGSSDLKVNY